MNQVNLCEIFTSIQGEGIFAGRAQLFIRFFGCNIKCYYCDTREAFEEQEFALFEKTPFSCKFKKIKNPITDNDLISYIKNILKGNFVHSISLTGGEPLLHVDFLESFIPKINKIKPIHLETNGTLPDNLRKIIKDIDFVSMDMKTDYFGKKGFLDAQKTFLEISSKKNCQVKVVVTKKLDEKSFIQAIEIIKEVDEKIPLILQPNTKELKQLKVKLLKFYKIASQTLDNVLILPQMHLLMDLK